MRAQEDLASYPFNVKEEEDPSSQGETSKDTEKSSSFFKISGKRKREEAYLQSSENQWRRVKQVGTQSFLYVGAYVLVNAWGFATLSLDAIDYEQTENPAKVFFPLLVMQSIFVPSQGLFNCLIFFRPIFIQTRTKFPGESTMWYIQKTVFRRKKVVDESPSSIENVLKPSTNEASASSNNVGSNQTTPKLTKESIGDA